MTFKDTVKHMDELLKSLIQDLEKAEGGNKAASQRVRTGTVKLEKIAKLYRKQSIESEKQGGSKKGDKAKASAKKAAPAKKAAAAPVKKAAPAKAQPKEAKVKAKPKAKAQKAVAKPRALSIKRPTAKLPVKRASR